MARFREESGFFVNPHESILISFDSPAQTGAPAMKAGPNALEMRLYSATGERAAFLLALDAEAPARRMYGHVLHYTGCRPTEALQLTVGRVLVSEQALWYCAASKSAR